MRGYISPATSSAAQNAARLLRVFRVNRFSALLNALDYSSFVDNKGRAAGQSNQRNQHTVIARDRFGLITQNGKFHAKVMGEGFVLLPAIHADANHLGSRLLEFGDIRLIRLQLYGSARCESLDVKSQHHAFPAPKITELDQRTFLISERKIGRAITDFECVFSHRKKHAAPCQQECPKNNDENFSQVGFFPVAGAPAFDLRQISAARLYPHAPRLTRNKLETKRKQGTRPTLPTGQAPYQVSKAKTS